MSIYQSSVAAFIELLESGIIPQSEITEFYQPHRDLQDDEKIVTAIEDWLNHPSRNQLFASYKEKLESLLNESNINISIETGAGGTKSPTKPNQPSQPATELFHNAMIKVTQANHSGKIQSPPLKP